MCVCVFCSLFAKEMILVRRFRGFNDSIMYQVEWRGIIARYVTRGSLVTFYLIGDHRLNGSHVTGLSIRLRLLNDRLLFFLDHVILGFLLLFLRAISFLLHSFHDGRDVNFVFALRVVWFYPWNV